MLKQAESKGEIQGLCVLDLVFVYEKLKNWEDSFGLMRYGAMVVLKTPIFLKSNNLLKLDCNLKLNTNI